MIILVLKLYAVKITASIRRTVCAVCEALIHLAMVGPNTGHTWKIVTWRVDTFRSRTMLHFFFSLLTSIVFHGMRANQGLLGIPFLGVGVSSQIVDEVESSRHDFDTLPLQHIRRFPFSHGGELFLCFRAPVYQ